MDLGFGGKNQNVGNHAASLMGKIVDIQESMLDEELHKLDNLNDDELAKLRSKRLAELRERKREEDEWSQNQHGVLSSLSDTKAFFDAAKKSRRLVVHFQRPTSHICVDLNGHLAKLAAMHRETRFCAMDAEKTPYLCEKILADPEGNVVIPTLLLCLDAKVIYHIRGLEEVGGEHTSPDRIATVLQLHGIIEGEAAKHQYEDQQPTFTSLEQARAHAIRSGFYDQMMNADDDDFDDDDFTGDAKDA